MSDEEFPRSGGRWSLDFIATFGRRHRTDTVERLADVTALRRWLGGAGLPVPTEITDSDLAAARVLREALHRLVRAHMAGEHPNTRDLTVVNRAAARADLAPRLDADGHCHYATEHPVTVAAVVSTLTRDGIDLIATAPPGRVKECGHPDCSLLFLDPTQGNRRRWCSMQRCGNQLKVAGYRGRRNAQDPPRP